MAKISLKACRINKNLTLEESAEALGVSSATLSAWENGYYLPNLKHVEKILNLYDVDYDDVNFFVKESD